MPTLTSSIPDEATTPALDIKRTPHLKALVAVVTSHDLLGTYTHWFRGRTIPCESPECEACTEGVPRRWHSWCGVWQVNSGDAFIFECTAAGAKQFALYRKAYDTLRGCLFQSTRQSSRPNARVLIRCKPADLGKIKLPPAPDLCKCMAIVWNLPADAVHAAGALNGLSRLHADSLRAGHDWNQFDPTQTLAELTPQKGNGDAPQTTQKSLAE